MQGRNLYLYVSKLFIKDSKLINGTMAVARLLNVMGQRGGNGNYILYFEKNLGNFQ